MEIRNERPERDYRFYCPSDTKSILYEVILKKSRWKYNQRVSRYEKDEWWYESGEPWKKNINLLFGRLIPNTLIKKEEKSNKEKYLEFIINEFNIFMNKKLDFMYYLLERRNSLKNELKEAGFYIISFVAKCPWRLVVGLGASHPQETSMTLHHIYGIPYIPGSAVKGVTRHWIVLKIASHYMEDTKSLENAVREVSSAIDSGIALDREINGVSFETLIEIFGNQRQAGKVIFMDAYPVHEIKLKLDIINPHYPDYYTRNKPPADWQNPNPIKFLTVENTEFEFTLVSREEKLVEIATSLLNEAIQNHGIGAKTSLGYGIFEIQDY